MAHLVLDAEETEFCWDARIEERWIGAYHILAEDELDLDRVRIVGRLDGTWFVAVMIVDGDGRAQGMIGKRTFHRRRRP